MKKEVKNTPEQKQVNVLSNEQKLNILGGLGPVDLQDGMDLDKKKDGLTCRFGNINKHC